MQWVIEDSSMLEGERCSGSFHSVIRRQAKECVRPASAWPRHSALISSRLAPTRMSRTC